jgi:positive regulator of sigma E activity
MRRRGDRQIYLALLVSLMVGLATAIRDLALGAVFAGVMLSMVLAVLVVRKYRKEGEEP